MTNTGSFGHAPNLNFDLNAALFNDMIDNINICNFYDPPELTHELNFFETSNLCISHINIHSMQKHINNLPEFLSNSSFFPDIMAITETRIKDQPAINIDIPGYKFFFVKSFNNAGGVGVYINDTLNCRVLNRFHVDLPSCENIWLNVITKDSKSYIVGVLYRHPFSTDVANFIDQLNQTLQDITSAGNKCVILGDFNIDILKLESAHIISYLNMLQSNAFHSIVDKPTRVTATSSTLIDHVLTNDAISQITPGILNSDVSDHFPTFVLIKNVDKKKVSASENRYYRCKTNFNLNSFLSDLQKSLT